MQGCMQRTMHLVKWPGSPTVPKSAWEFTCKPVVSGVNSREEQVRVLRQDPLRMERFSSSTAPTTRCVLMGKPSTPSALHVRCARQSEAEDF